MVTSIKIIGELQKKKKIKKQHITTTTKFSMNDSCLSVHQGVILMDKNTKLN